MILQSIFKKRKGMKPNATDRKKPGITICYKVVTTLLQS